jgi:hypothetical protein
MPSMGTYIKAISGYVCSLAILPLPKSRIHADSEMQRRDTSYWWTGTGLVRYADRGGNIQGKPCSLLQMPVWRSMKNGTVF